MSPYGRCAGCHSYGRWGHPCICNTPEMRPAIPSVQQVSDALTNAFPELDVTAWTAPNGRTAGYTLDFSHLGRSVTLDSPAAAAFHQVQQALRGLAGVHCEWQNDSSSSLRVTLYGTELRAARP